MTDVTMSTDSALPSAKAAFLVALGLATGVLVVLNSNVGPKPVVLPIVMIAAPAVALIMAMRAFTALLKHKSVRGRISRLLLPMMAVLIDLAALAVGLMIAILRFLGPT